MLYQWAHRLSVAAAAAGGKPHTRKRRDVAFAELRIRDESRGDQREAARSRGVIEIVSRSGRVVRVQGDVDVAQLRAVLEVVEQC